MGENQVDIVAHFFVVHKLLLLVERINAMVDHAQQVGQVAHFHLLGVGLQLVVAKAANLVGQGLGIFEHTAHLIQLVAVFGFVKLLAEQLGIVASVGKHHALDFTQLRLDYLHILEHRNAYGCQGFFPIFKHALVAAVQFAQILIVRVLKVLFDVGKVNHIAVFEVLVGSVDTCQGLQQVVAVHLSGEIQAFQASGIKTCQQHPVDNQQVDVVFLLEVVNDSFTFLLVAFIVQNQCSLWHCQFIRQSGCGQWIICVNFIDNKRTLDIFPVVNLVESSCLRIGFADNHARNGLVVFLDAEPLQIPENIVEQTLQIVVRFNDDRFAHIAFLHLGIVLLRLVEQADQFFLV